MGKKLDFGRLRFTPGCKNKLEKLTVTEGEDEPIVLDPFTDPDDGIAVILHYDPKAKDKNNKPDLKNIYNVELEQKKVSKFGIELVPTPLTDEDIENLLKQESLEKMYINSYRKKDFQYALDGLKYIDKENGYGVFENTEFLEVVEEISNYYPEESEEVDDVEENTESTTTSGDDLVGLTRDELKALIRKEFEEGEIIVRKSYSDADIANLIREKRKEKAATSETVTEVDDEVEDDPKDLPFEKDKETKAPATSKASDRLAKMSENLKKNKK
jgi:hypothetical protein